jgi:hypothetical protein
MSLKYVEAINMACKAAFSLPSYQIFISYLFVLVQLVVFCLIRKREYFGGHSHFYDVVLPGSSAFPNS